MENHHTSNAVRSSNLAQETPILRSQTGFDLQWSPEELAILDAGLVKYASDKGLTLYLKIAAELKEKTVRDVAIRCNEMKQKESNKRSREDHYESAGKEAKFDNKEITYTVVALQSDTNPFAASPLLREDELLQQNEQLFQQIYSNLTSSNVDNLTMLSKVYANFGTLLNNENVPEQVKYLPPLQERLVPDELIASVLYPDPPEERLVPGLIAFM